MRKRLYRMLLWAIRLSDHGAVTFIPSVVAEYDFWKQFA